MRTARLLIVRFKLLQRLHNHVTRLNPLPDRSAPPGPLPKGEGRFVPMEGAPGWRENASLSVELIAE